MCTLLGILVISGILWETFAFAEDKPTSPPLTLTEENLPDIEAKTFTVKVVRRSSSNKIYLFDDIDNRQSAPGRILLLKRETEPVMALRVLKNYPDENRVAAKRIKRYGNHRTLENSETFTAIEKISDIAPPEPTLEDQADLKELEEKKTKLEIKAFDPELDGSSSQKPLPKEEETVDENDDELQSTEEHLAVTVEDVATFEKNRHWITAGFGFIRNVNTPTAGGFYYFSSGNVRYGVNLGQLVFLDRPHLQDSLTLEGGFYLYKSINFVSAGDAYTVMSFVGNLRYNIFFSERLGIFFSAGMMKSSVTSSSQGQSDVITALNSLLPVIGTGILFEVGPSWYTRIDAGIDTASLNLVLRF
jgi:hypothetical protein